MTAYSFKRRFVDPICVGLGLPLESEMAELQRVIGSTEIVPKLQTIRAVGKRRHARVGEVIQLYHGMRTKQCFKIGDAKCIGVDQIEIDVREHALPIRVFGDWLKGGFGHDFARADGFQGLEDMHDFWKQEYGIGNFRGVLIRWEPIANIDSERAAA